MAKLVELEAAIRNSDAAKEKRLCRNAWRNGGLCCGLTASTGTKADSPLIEAATMFDMNEREANSFVGGWDNCTVDDQLMRYPECFALGQRLARELIDGVAE